MKEVEVRLTVPEDWTDDEVKRLIEDGSDCLGWPEETVIVLAVEEVG